MSRLFFSKPKSQASDSAPPSSSSSADSKAQMSKAKDDAEKDKSTEQWVRTDMGYGKLQGAHSKVVRVELPWGSISLPQAQVNTELALTVFTFYEDKPPLSITVNLSDRFRSLRKRVSEQYNTKEEDIRFISQGYEIPSSHLDLPLGLCSLPCKPPFELLVIVTEKPKFQLDPNQKSSNIEIASDGLTASIPEGGNSSDSAVRGNLEFESGRVFWDVKVVNCPSGKLNLGVCEKGVNMSSYIGSNEHGWSYYGTNGKAEFAGDSRDFGPKFNSGDVVRVKLNMEDRTLSFCLNGDDLGVAHRSLPGKVWPAFSLYNRGDSFTIMKFGTFD